MTMNTLPEEFEQYTRSLMGENLYARLEDGLREDVPVSIRLNRAKCGENAMPVEANGQVPWCADGYYLSHRPTFTFDPLLHAGLYYVQEASSMFVSRVMEQYFGERTEPMLALDMCAAPGGKSTAVVAAMPLGSVLVSNEPIRQRAQVLAENMHKWGHPDTIVTNNYPADFSGLHLVADLVVCDVPCSGEGMFRKDEGAIAEWSVQNVRKCADLQRDIVEKVWHLLRPGGIMVYSTCTFNAHENEENVDWICREYGAELLPVDIEEDWNITGSLCPDLPGTVYRFLPGLTRGEGLFMAVLRKNEEQSLVQTKSKKKGKGRDRLSDSKSMKGGGQLKAWLSDPSRYDVVQTGERFLAMSSSVRQVYGEISSRLNVLKAGVTLGCMKGRDVIPHQSLACSTILAQGAFAHVSLSYAEAIAYLRKETFPLPEAVPCGFVVVEYEGFPLGFVKNIGHRANNLYPQEWRIKNTHLPEEKPVIRI